MLPRELIPLTGRQAEAFASGCGSWRKWEASVPPWLLQTASCRNKSQDPYSVNNGQPKNHLRSAVPGHPEESTIERPEARHGHQNGNYRR